MRGMDTLLWIGRHETSHTGDGRMDKKPDQGLLLEAMETDQDEA